MIERLPTARVLLLFFGYVARTVEEQFQGLHRDIRSARFETTYHTYLARTMLYAVASFLAVLGLSVVLGTVYLRTEVLGGFDRLALVSGLFFPALVVGYAVYRARLYYPRYVAERRARAIELSMPNATNFLLALSRAGVSTPKTIEVLSDHAGVLGEAADEFRYAYRDMEYFGADVVAALSYLSETTRLDDLSDFLDGYLRALTGRGDTNRFLEEAMTDLFEKAELEQDEFLSRLGVLAEVYVAVFVAFPIFALIILVVMGFVGTPDILLGIRVVVYAVIPLTALAFLLVLDTTMANPLAATGSHRELEASDLYDESLRHVPTADRGDPGATEANLRALDRYRSKQRASRLLGAPLTLLRRQPRYALYVGVLVALAYLGLKAGLGFVSPGAPIVPTVPVSGDHLAVLRALDASLVEALVIVLAIYGVFYEIRARYLAAVERQLPDFLDELSGRHGIGMSLSESIATLRDRDMGRMNVEIERMTRDFELNSPAGDVLVRFANRVRSPVVTRVVVLLTAANEAAERLEPVIVALADRAELDRRLKRERQVEMSLYVVIIYVSYLVLLSILVILQGVFLPKVPAGDVGVGLAGASGFDPESYRTIFFHLSVIQGVFSGFVGGKMSEGTLSAGVKHALAMVVMAYVVFVLVLPNVTIQV